MNESGIDIWPAPGKKLQNIAMTVGRRSPLTAMALLMAIFRFHAESILYPRRSRAPLDEPNIMRLTRLIKEMSATTQFIVMPAREADDGRSKASLWVTHAGAGVSRSASGFEAPPVLREPVAVMAGV